MAKVLRRIDRPHHERLVLEQGRRDLVAWAADDLRAPLTGLRAMIEAVEAGAVRGPDELRRCHQRMLREIGHLGDLLDDLAVLGNAALGDGPGRIERSGAPERAFDLAYGDGIDGDGFAERGRSDATG